MLYHDSPFTLEPERVIPEDAPLAAGQVASAAQQLADASQTYASEPLTLEVTTEGVGSLNAHAVVSFGSLTFDEDYQIHLNWGDGVDEHASEPEEGHPYAQAGTYLVTATVLREEQASLQRYANVTVPDDTVIAPGDTESGE